MSDQAPGSERKKKRFLKTQSVIRGLCILEPLYNKVSFLSQPTPLSEILLKDKVIQMSPLHPFLTFIVLFVHKVLLRKLVLIVHAALLS